ncbi:hypothetical protein SDC9_113979 [bioreactor metagenome]|uniref:Uncharacterized protein n=2 Tax=root TaxID=1 RepID=A0A1W1IG63_9LACT|nr:hypothetical protein SAMN04488086_11743 [Trichococcus pasteurii]SLM52014.1 Hypothetical protein TPAS_1694 [Trichococcus pasteurii]SSB92895.1 Hypothetical protein TPAS_1694 [Trichococcus pasteurii]
MTDVRISDKEKVTSAGIFKEKREYAAKSRKGSMQNMFSLRLYVFF